MKKIFTILLLVELLFGASSTPIKSGETIQSSVKHKEKRFYKITVPKNRSLYVNLTELEEDVDLYVKKGKKITIRQNDCYSSKSSTKDEECTLTNKGKKTTYTILVYGFKASSFKLKATIKKPKRVRRLSHIPIHGKVKHEKGKLYKVNGEKSKTITITLSDLTADADLRVKVGKEAGLHSFDCKSNHGGTTTDECTITPKIDATIYVHVYGYEASSYSLKAVQGSSNPCITRSELDRKIENDEDVTDVNTSCITDMSNLFFKKHNFNQDISNWDVSHVTNMEDMFYYAENFNQDISNWNVSKVKNMSGMFLDAEKFNQDIGNWDVSNVINMSSMFEGKATSLQFNQDISNWNVSRVLNMDYMFSQNIGNESNFKNHDLSNWHVVQVRSHTDFMNPNHTNIEPKWIDILLY